MYKLYRRKDRAGREIPIWYVYFLDREGQVFRGTTRQVDKKRADYAARELYRRHGDPTFKPASEKTFEGALRQMLKEADRSDLSKETVKSYTEHGTRVAAEIGPDTLLSEFSAKFLDAFVNRRLGGDEEKLSAPVLQHTVHKELTVVRLVLKSALRRGEFDGRIDEVMPKLSTGYKPVQRHIPYDRWDDVLKAITKRSSVTLSSPVAWILGTGCSYRGLANAHRSDVDWSHNTVKLRESKTAYRFRTIPIISILEKYVRHALDHAPGDDKLFRTWHKHLREVFDKALEDCGLEHMSPNDLRRSTSRALKAHGVPNSILATFLGHADETMVRKVYGRETAVEVAPAFEAAIKTARKRGVQPVSKTGAKRATSETVGRGRKYRKTG